MKEQVFAAEDESLVKVTAFVESELERVDCSPKTMMQISVALEEAFVNVAHYAYPGTKGSVLVSIAADEAQIRICLADSGIPFNPLERADPDITASAEDRQIGGLGIFMVKKAMDQVQYEYKDGQNILTMQKNRR